jgi:hypothetical protein
MANAKISALTGATTPLAGTEVLPIVQSSVTKNVSVANLTAGRDVSATKFIPTGTSVTGNGMYLPAANSVGISTNGVNAVYIDASQNVGVGTTPGTKLDIVGSINTGLRVSDGTTTGIFFPSSENTNSLVVGTTTNHPLVFYTNNSARARITSGGDLLVATASLPIANTRVGISGASSAGLGLLSYVNTGASTKKWSEGPDSNGNFVVFNDATTGVYITYGGVAWIANSDERLKTTIKPFENAVEKICSLRSGTGRYLTDNESVSRSFLIAQDVQKILPEAVNVQDDEQKTLGLAYTDLIPLLVAAIKEQQATITFLTARIEALESK